MIWLTIAGWFLRARQMASQALSWLLGSPARICAAVVLCALLWGYVGDMRHFPKHCDGAHPVCADQIYAASYMADPGALAIIELSPAITAELVDIGVNMGPQRPLPWFREGLNALGGFRLPVNAARLTADDAGALAQLRARKGGLWTCVAMLDYLDARQRQRYDAIVRADPSQQVFYKGWIRWRIGNVDRRECRKEAA